MADPQTIVVESAAVGMLTELDRAISSLKGCKASREAFAELELRLLEMIDDGRAFDLDTSSASADKMIVRLKLSQAFLDLVAAFVAANSENGILEHGRSVSRVAEAGSDLNSGPAVSSHDSEQPA